MSSRLVGSLIVGTGLAVMSGDALSQNSVDFQGRRYTCQTKCVITVTGGRWTVVDVNGGRVTWTIPPTTPPDCNQTPELC